MTDISRKATAAADAAPSPAPAKVSSKLIGKVGVELEAWLGKARMTVAELAELKPDTVVALDVQLNEAIEIRLNDTVVAKGEIVAVEDRFGVRLTEIVKWPD